MKLHYKKLGKGEPVIILHGLYGSSDNWLSIGKELAKHYTVWLVDQRNHGRSPQSEDINYSLMINDLREFIDEHSIKNPVLAGHSMGGKTVMLYTLDQPSSVKKMIVIDIAPGSLAKKYFIAYHEMILNSMASLDLNNLKTYTEAEKELMYKLKDIRLVRFLLKSLKKNNNTRFRWAINISAILKGTLKLLASIEEYKRNNSSSNIPALFIRGSLSGYISDNDIPDIKRIFTNSIIEAIPDAGHWLHAEQPETLIRILLTFLNDQ